MFYEYPKMIYKDETRSERRIVQNAEEEAALLALWQPKGALDKAEAPKEEAKPETKKNPATMSKAELVTYAMNEFSLELTPDSMTKADMLKAIKAAK